MDNVFHNIPQDRTESNDEEAKERICPANTNLIDQRHHTARHASSKPAPNKIVGRCSGTSSTRIDVDEQDGDGIHRCADTEADQEEEGTTDATTDQVSDQIYHSTPGNFNGFAGPMCKYKSSRWV